MKKARSSIMIIGVLALVTFALVAGVLSAAQKKAPVVVATRGLEAGTKFSLTDTEFIYAAAANSHSPLAKGPAAPVPHLVVSCGGSFARITHRRIDLKKARSSLVIIGALALITFVLVAGVLAAAQKKTPVVVAARALEAGTKLSLADVEVKQVHAGAALESVFAKAEDVVGLVITVQRLPGDQLTADMVGDAAQNALAQALDPDHRAVAIHVDQASGLAGLLRPGDTVSVVGIVDPSTLGGMGIQRATGAGAKVLLTNLKVLFVPYEFRYRELNTDDSGGAMSPVMSSSSDREKGVIVLSVPVQPITVTWQISTVVPVAADVRPSNTTSTTVGTSDTTTQTVLVGAPTTTRSETALDPNPTLRVSPVELLTLLDSQAAIYLVMEPAVRGDEVQTPGIYLVDLLPDVAATPATDEPAAVFVGGQ